MTNRERFLSVFDFKPVDRMPAIELMVWWDKTRSRWESEGLPNLAVFGNAIGAYWKLDDHRQFGVASETMDLHGHKIQETRGFIKNEEDYERILPLIYPKDAVLDNWIEDELLNIRDAHDAGDFPVWMTFSGYFWLPRVLFGIEPHLYSFYDYPELYHRICRDQAEFHLRVIDDFCSVLTPDFMSFAEDMSYKHGPMISENMFNEFIRPYYEIVIPALHKHNIKVFIDTDGDFMPMARWLLDSGADGVLPLERRAGVDVCSLRAKYPGLLMIGGFDKTVIRFGEDAMRKEFERLVPVMKAGGFIPSVDHQTPPDVSLENYGIYRRLQDEYCNKYHP